MNYNVKRLTMAGLLTALEIVLSRFLSIATPFVKIGFAFIPIVIAAVLYGPLWAGACAAIGDLLGALLFPIGAYFPGFTLTAFLSGVFFGLFLYGKPFKLRNALTSSVLVSVLNGFLIDTLWLYIIMGSGVYGFIPTRAIKAAVMLVVETVVIILLVRMLSPLVKKEQENKTRLLRAISRAFFRNDKNDREQISEKITSKILAMKEFKAAKTLFCFVGIQTEIDTTDVITAALHANKTVCVPLCGDDRTMTAHRITSLSELEEGKYGLLEPNPNAPIIAAESIDFAVVPCSVCDKKRNRIGKGGGFYDKFLKEMLMFKAAVAPDELVFSSVPHQPHDIAMDAVVTEKKIYR